MAAPEVAFIDACAYRRGCDRNRGEEALKAVVQQCAVAKSQGIIPQVIEISCRKVTDAIEQAESAGRLDQWRRAPHPLGPALTVVAEEQLVAALAAQHDLHMLRCRSRQIPERNRRVGG